MKKEVIEEIMRHWEPGSYGRHLLETNPEEAVKQWEWLQKESKESQKPDGYWQALAEEAKKNQKPTSEEDFRFFWDPNWTKKDQGNLEEMLKLREEKK